MAKPYRISPKLVALVLLLASGCVCAAAEQAKLPNLVILYADDMGYGDMKLYNPESKIPTPHLDQLAREGMRFTDGHSSSGICTPSRYALFTGQYHWRKLNDFVKTWQSSIFNGEFMLQHMLREKGYTTACIGKWHMGFNWEALLMPGEELGSKRNPPSPKSFDWTKKIPGGPTENGFDYYFGDDMSFSPPYAWIENDKLTEIPTVMYESNPVPQEGKSACVPGPAVAGWRLDAVMPTMTQKAVEWIAQQKTTGKPFYLYFSYTAPHDPIVPTEQFQGISGAGPFGDFVAQGDWTAGQIMQALKDNGFEDNTIVVFSSDNGPETHMQARIKKFDHNSSGPLRGMKRDIYEGGHRVPFIIKWPGVIQPGRVTDAITSQIDIMPTMASAIGYELPKDLLIDGIDMMPVLKGEKEFVRDELVSNTRPDIYAMRQGDWIIVNEAGKKNAPYALYNLKEDLGQHHNLASQYPEKVEQLQKLLEQVQNKKVP